MSDLVPHHIYRFVIEADCVGCPLSIPCALQNNTKALLAFRKTARITRCTHCFWIEFELPYRGEEKERRVYQCAVSSTGSTGNSIFPSTIHNKGDAHTRRNGHRLCLNCMAEFADQEARRDATSLGKPMRRTLSWEAWEEIVTIYHVNHRYPQEGERYTTSRLRRTSEMKNVMNINR